MGARLGCYGRKTLVNFVSLGDFLKMDDQGGEVLARPEIEPMNVETSPPEMVGEPHTSLCVGEMRVHRRR